MFVLGVNISHHPSVCLLDDGEVVYYLEDDRLNRNKEVDWEYDSPMTCLTCVREYTEHVDHIIFCSYIKTMLLAFLSKPPKVEFDINLFNKITKEGLPSKNHDDLTIDQVKKNLKLYGITYDEEHFLPEHHLFHASSAFYSSPFDEAAALICDGGGAPLNEVIGNRESESMYYLSGNNIETIHKHHGMYEQWAAYSDSVLRVNDKVAVSHSLSNAGLFNLFCGVCHLGSSVDAGAGRGMGVSPYGKVDDYPEEWFYYDEEGDIWVTDNDIIVDTCRRVLCRPDFDPEVYKYNDELYDSLKVSFEDMSNLLAKVQLETKKHTIRLIKQLLDKTDTKNVVLSGGYFLNCVNNYHYIKEFPEINFYVDPCAHDGGTAIGAAFYVWHHLLDNKQRYPLTSLFLG